MLTSHPSSSPPVTSAQPSTQAYLHPPAAQDVTMFGRGAQAWRQAPQCDTEISKSVSQPSPNMLSLQLPNPSRQVAVQVPRTHKAWLMFGRFVEQRFPQAPQFATSFMTSMQASEDESQRAWPVAHA